MEPRVIDCSGHPRERDGTGKMRDGDGIKDGVVEYGQWRQVGLGKDVFFPGWAGLSFPSVWTG
jgi:hypothetical protein